MNGFSTFKVLVEIDQLNVSQPQPDIVLPEIDVYAEISAIEYSGACDDEYEAKYGEVWCNVGREKILMLIDSGAHINTVSERCWHELERKQASGAKCYTRLSASEGRKICAYASREPLCVLARFRATITTQDLTRPKVETVFYAIKGAERNLLGKSTAREMGVLRMGDEVDWIAALTDALDGVEEFPRAPVPEVKFDIDTTIAPSQQCYVRIPDAFRERALERLLKMEKEGIIERVKGSPKWISGLNVVMKGPRDFRLTLNMKKPNQAIKRPFYPIPTLERIRQMVDGATKFTKLDLTQAFYHLVLHETAREMTNFMTSYGIFRYVRMPFGANSAPEIFQRFMEEAMKGIKGLVIFLDDMLIFGKDLEELRSNTHVVLERSKQFNLTLNLDKCELEKDELTFLGHRFNKDGINIEENKIKSILAYRSPQSSSEVRSFMGLANYVQSYIPNYGDIAEGIWLSLADKRHFTWGQVQEDAFQEMKQAIAMCTTVLGAFREDEETFLYTDASGVAVGAVLTQRNSKGSWRTISFASKKLTPAERRYYQSSREAFAIVWAVERFQHYLIGRPFTVMTDSSGAIALMTGDTNEKTKRVLHRTEGWKHRLEIFDITFRLIRGKDNIADSASRLGDELEEEWQLGDDHEIASIEPEISLQFSERFLTNGEVKKETETDVEFARLVKAMETQEWTSDLARYEAFKEELSLVEGMVVRVDKIVLPVKCRLKALQLAHGGHAGMSATKKSLA